MNLIHLQMELLRIETMCRHHLNQRFFSLFVCSATVHITVEDENEFEPEFTEGAYQATARENHMHISPPILQVGSLEATDRVPYRGRSHRRRYQLQTENAEKH